MTTPTTCPCGTPDVNGHHVCPDLPREEVHTTSEGLATVTIYTPSGQVLGIGHGFTLSDARAQAQDRARGGDVVEADIEDICWACDGATDEQTHTCDRYTELTPSDLEHLDSPTGTVAFQVLVTEYLEANADDGDGPPSVWDFVLWTLHR